MNKCKFCSSYDGMTMHNKPYTPSEPDFGFICRTCGKVSLVEPQ